MNLKLEGIFAPIVTPFDHNGDLYPAKLRHNIEKWNRTALAGYVVASSSGEAALLTSGEKSSLWELAAGWAAPGRMLIADTGAESVRETVALTQHAASLGYHAALVLTPHVYKHQMVRQDTQALYYRAVADQSPLPVLIYNHPRLTGVDIAAETVVALSYHPNLAGILETSGSVERIMRLAGETRSGFAVLTGSAPTLWPSLLMGATGAMLAYANAAPFSLIALWEAFRKREDEAARDWQARIAPAAKLVTTRYGIAGLKYAMDLNGYYGGLPRLPLLPLSAVAKAVIESAFAGIKG
jgi:4-hydroxy-2-oxoglutarate aldolase